MEDARIEALRRAYDAFNRRDTDALLAQLERDVKWPNVAEGTTLRGHYEVLEYWRQQWETTEPRVDPVEFRVAGDWLVARVDQVVTDKSDNLLLSQTVAHAYAFAPNGGISEMVVFDSLEVAIATLGNGR